MQLFDPPADAKMALRRQLLQTICQGGCTLNQALQQCSVTRLDLAIWMDDPEFGKQLIHAQKRGRQLQRLELDMQRSVSIQRRSAELENSENPAPDEESDSQKRADKQLQ
jgi:hypothetical protein